LLPKLLLPLDDISILEVIVKQLAAAGASRIVLCMNHHSSLFARFFDDGRRAGLPLESVTESEPLGTAGPLLLIPNLVDRHFLVANGDVLTTLDFRKVFAAHTSSRAVAIVCTAKIPTPIDYGVITTGPDGKVKQYAEKPVLEHHVSMGINVLSQEAWRSFPRMSAGTCRISSTQWPPLASRVSATPPSAIGRTSAENPTTNEP
jgi:NDP-sugar pyrophosphorylase family protein